MQMCIEIKNIYKAYNLIMLRFLMVLSERDIANFMLRNGIAHIF